MPETETEITTNSPSSPTTSTSTPERASMDGSTNQDHRCRCIADTLHTTEDHRQALRPVVPSGMRDELHGVPDRGKLARLRPDTIVGVRAGDLRDAFGVYELRERGLRVLDDDQCCELGCSGGACESCPCCCAGWCVWGTDGLPDRETDAENYAIWLEEASEHNPVARRLAELGADISVDGVPR